VNTKRLIEVLGTNLQPVDRRGFAKSVVLAVAVGAVAAFGMMLATIGPRPQLASLPHLEWSAIKLLFALSVVGTGVANLVRSARPGAPTRSLPAVLPFLVVGAAALAVLLLTTPGAWKHMLLGAAPSSPGRCLLCIIGFAALPLLALIHVLREGAPTRPGVCGAMAGAVAGGAGAAAYTLACRSDSILFITVWYVAGIALCAALGAVLGPRLLRW